LQTFSGSLLSLQPDLDQAALRSVWSRRDQLH